VAEPLPGYAATVEQEELRESLRKFLATTTPESVVRKLVDTSGGFDRATWIRLGSEIGAFGLAVPEDLGGAGAGLVEQAIACEEFGRSLLPGPVFGTVDLAIPLLCALGGDEVLPSLIRGQSTAAVALPCSGTEFDAQSIRIVESRGQLTGEIPQVVDGDADWLVVAAERSEGFGLFLVDAADRVWLPTLDQTRRQARVSFDGVETRLLATGADAHQAVERALCVGTALLAAEQVGGAQRLLDMSVEYAGTRSQFGRRIGSFQAIKHKCADMLVGLEWARSASAAALESVDGDAAEMAGESDWRASMAKAVCSEALRDAAHANVQIHGGIGFTWEDSAHLYLRRARTDEVLFGGPGQHWDRLAARKKLL